jgi:hypothetical protein
MQSESTTPPSTSPIDPPRNDTLSPKKDPSDKMTAKKMPETNFDMMGDELGPLLPEHLIEAVRRIKKDREAYGTGFLGLSLEGRENTAARVNGKKLFR